MNLHLINGFLGSGKTTAIITATKKLIQRGNKVGIVTNDKGQFQVDTAFFQSSHIPTRQVTGGCFRCSFSEFEEKIAQLQAANSPDIIFAESVGSCVDLVNTIFSPIQQNHLLQVEKTTYSVFSDIRLYRRWLYNEPLPFSETIQYLFSKQIEESKLLILNKADLMTADRQHEIFALTSQKYPDKIVLLQNSLDSASVEAWLDAVEAQEILLNQPGFSVDYPTYKSGEKEMAWLDQQILLEAEDPAAIKPALIRLINSILDALRNQNVLVGHMKLFLETPGEGTKISFATADFFEKAQPAGWEAAIPETGAKSLSVMLNARVALPAQDFYNMVKDAVRTVTSSLSARVLVLEGSAYNPVMSLKRPAMGLR